MSALQDQHSAWKAARARLGGYAPVPKPVAIPEPVRVSYGAPFDFYSPVGYRNIVQFVALQHGLAFAQIIDQGRGKSLVAARNQAIQLCFTHLRGLSFPELGRIFGGMHHSSIMHALRKTSRWKRRETARAA